MPWECWTHSSVVLLSQLLASQVLVAPSDALKLRETAASYRLLPSAWCTSPRCVLTNALRTKSCCKYRAHLNGLLSLQNPGCLCPDGFGGSAVLSNSRPYFLFYAALYLFSVRYESLLHRQKGKSSG